MFNEDLKETRFTLEYTSFILENTLLSFKILLTKLTKLSILFCSKS